MEDLVTARLAVVIPTCDRAHLLAPTLDALADAGLPVEICVSDNASKDGTPDLLADFAGRWPLLRTIRQRNRLPLIANHQAAMRLAGAPYMLVIGDDDRLCPDALRAALDKLDADPKLAAIYGTFDIRDAETDEHRVYRRPSENEVRRTWADRHRLFEKSFMMECVLMRTEVAQRHFVHAGRRHPLGWLLLNALLGHGDVLLSPEVLVVKADFAGREGYRNYERWFQDHINLDIEAFFAPDPPGAGRELAIHKGGRFLAISAQAARNHGLPLMAATFLERLSAAPSPHWPAGSLSDLVAECVIARMRLLAADCRATRLVVENVPPLPALASMAAAGIPGLAVALRQGNEGPGEGEVMVVAGSAPPDVDPGRYAILADMVADLGWAPP